MNQYMIDFDLPEEMTSEFLALIPAQRAQVNEMMEEGYITNYILSLDRSKLWVIVVAETEEEAWELIDEFPLRDFMKAQLYELMFHNSISQGLPLISLN